MVCFAGVSCSYLKRKKISVYNVWCKSQVLFSWCYTTDWRVFWKVWRAFFKKRGVNLINIEARTFQKLWCDFAENCGAHALAKNCCAFQWKLWRAQLKIMACFVTKMGMWNVFIVTSGKLWLKMRRMSIIWHVLHICVSSLRLKHRMSLIQRALDSPGLVDYFSYPHHGWKVRKKDFRAIWKQKLASKMRKVRNFEMVKSAWKRDFSTANFFFESF